MTTDVAAAGFDPARIPWHLGTSDESYGTLVWANRVANLRGHLAIILDHLPEDRTWLARQVGAAIATADGYLRDWSPLCDSDGSPKGGDAEGGSVHDSAGPQDIAPSLSSEPSS